MPHAAGPAALRELHTTEIGSLRAQLLEWRQTLSLRLDGRWEGESEVVSPGQLMEVAANEQLSTKAANPRRSSRAPSLAALARLPCSSPR